MLEKFTVQLGLLSVVFGYIFFMWLRIRQENKIRKKSM